MPRSGSFHSSFVSPCLVLVALSCGVARANEPPPAWQNPDIGVVADLAVDAHDAAGAGAWRSEGLRLRAMELEISSNIDPRARLTTSVAVSDDGAELHELYAEFPALPGGLKLKAGQMLANFGRWGRFHGHALPFTSEPRILREYAGGGLLLAGAELSWLLPLARYVEASVGVYNAIEGHGHDADPFGDHDAHSAAAIAAEEGCTSHGGHWHCSDGDYSDEELLALHGHDDHEPVSRFAGRRADELAVGARVQTTAEFGPDWSLDLGASGIYQRGYKRSQRVDGLRHSKAMAGIDATFFWHPLARTRYRGLDFGVELLANREGFEHVHDADEVHAETLLRGGAFGHIRYRHDERWHVGAFGEVFQARSGDGDLRRREGAFVTLNLSHFQFLRLEAARHERGDGTRAMHRVQLQYDAVIGHHTHGVRR